MANPVMAAKVMMSDEEGWLRKTIGEGLEKTSDWFQRNKVVYLLKAGVRVVVGKIVGNRVNPCRSVSTFFSLNMYSGACSNN